MSPIYEHIVQDGWGIIPGLVLFFAFVIGHALGDYPLQGEFLAMGKNRHHSASIPNPGKGSPTHIWIHCLTAHCLIHSGTVWIVTGLFSYAIVEFVLHWIIDFLKCENITTFTQDQVLHIGCKGIFVIMLWQGVWVPS